LRFTEVNECGVADQVDVDGIQHQLDGHEDQDGAPAGKHSVQPNTEQGRCQDLEVS
jgi:hypothetical protein